MRWRALQALDPEWEEYITIANDPDESRRVEKLEGLIADAMVEANELWDAAGKPGWSPVEPRASAADHYRTIGRLRDDVDIRLQALGDHHSPRAAGHRASAQEARGVVSSLYTVAMVCDYAVEVPTEFILGHQVQGWMLTLAEAAARAEVVCRRECIFFIAAEAVRLD